MEEKVIYIERMLNSNLFNVTEMSKLCGIGLSTLLKFKSGKGMQVRPYIVEAMYVYLKKIGD